jgi:hypothetical protein
MSQYKAGTIQVDTGSLVVHGSGTEFLANAQAGALFAIPGSPVHYQVGQVVDDATIRLTGPFLQESLSGSAYAITRDFTPYLGLVELAAGDTNVLQLLTETLRKIDLNLGQGLSAGVVPTPAERAADGDIIQVIGYGVNGVPDSATQALIDAKVALGWPITSIWWNCLGDVTSSITPDGLFSKGELGEVGLIGLLAASSLVGSSLLDAGQLGTSSSLAADPLSGSSIMSTAGLIGIMAPDSAMSTSFLDAGQLIIPGSLAADPLLNTSTASAASLIGIMSPDSAISFSSVNVGQVVGVLASASLVGLSALDLATITGVISAGPLSNLSAFDPAGLVGVLSGDALISASSLDSAGLGSMGAIPSAPVLSPLQNGVGFEQLTATWANSENALSYSLYWENRTNSEEYGLITNVTSPYSISGPLTSGVIYNVWIIAINGGNQAASNIRYAAAASLWAPLSPVDLSSTSALSAAGLSGIVAPDSLASASTVAGNQLLGIVGGDQLSGSSAADAAQLVGTLAANSLASLSALDQGGLVTAATAPGTPTLTLTAGNAQVSVAFTVPATTTDIDIWAYQSGGSPSAATIIASGTQIQSSGTSSPKLHTDLTNGQIWWYTAKARNAAGSSAPSTAVSAVPTAGYIAATDTFESGNDGWAFGSEIGPDNGEVGVAFRQYFAGAGVGGSNYYIALGAAQSWYADENTGPIVRSYAEKTITTGSSISFYFQASAPLTAPPTLEIDGIPAPFTMVAGNSWQLKSFSVTPGLHTFRVYAPGHTVYVGFFDSVSY